MYLRQIDKPIAAMSAHKILKVQVKAKGKRAGFSNV
jgi:hypothetical protein